MSFRGAPVLASAFLSGCLFLYSVDDSTDPPEGGGGSGGGLGGEGGAGSLVSYAIGDSAPWLAWNGDRGAALTIEGSLWRLSALAAPVRIADKLGDASGIAVTSSGPILVAKRSFAAPATAVLQCDDAGCSDWVTSTAPDALSGLATFADRVAGARRDDGRAEIFNETGESLELLGDVQDGGGPLAARRCGMRDVVAWVAEIGSGSRLWRASRATSASSFDEPEVLELGAEAISLSIASDCRVFYLSPKGGSVRVFAWGDGESTAMDLGIESTSDGQIAAGEQRLFLTLPSEAGPIVGACALPDPGSLGCDAAPVACERIGGIAADLATDDGYFGCDDSVLRWPP